MKGHVRQSGLHQRVDRPPHLLEPAIVLETYLPGHPRNKTGSDVECDVIITRTRQFLFSVPVMQRGSGTFSQAPKWVPVPSRTDLGSSDGTIRLSGESPGESITRLDDLDGEQVIVAYIRSRNVMPIIIGGMAHSHSKLVHKRVQGRLYNLVHQGTSVGVDDGGAVFVDIRQANSSPRSDVSLNMKSEQAVTIIQGPTTLSIRSSDAGATTLTHASGALITFEPNGDMTVRAKRDLRLEDGRGQFVELSGNGADIEAGAFEFEETSSSAGVPDRGRFELDNNGFKISRNGEELFDILDETLSALRGLFSTTGGGPLVVGAGGTSAATTFAELQLRLRQIGDI